MQKIVQAQDDFTGGEVDPQGKRRVEDNPLAKTACRILSNWKPRTTGTLDIRPGRRALAISTGARAERFRMTPTQELLIVFTAGAVTITDLAGDVIATNESASYLWTAATVAQISWTVCPDRIVICYPGMQPQLVMWAQATNTFTFAPFTFATSLNQSQEPFYRFAAMGATMMWNSGGAASPTVGDSITLTCSESFFTNAMIGTKLSILGAQVVITAVTSPTVATATVESQFNPAVYFYVPDGGANGYLTPSYFPADILAESTIDGWEIEVAGATADIVYGVATKIGSLLAQSTTGDVLVSQFGSNSVNVAALATDTDVQTVQWQQEFMSALNGWPSCCFFDRDRLGFCGFPQMPEAVLWSAVGAYDTFWVDSAAAAQNPDAGSAPTAAILEFISGKPSVQNVVGWNGDEFVFTDKGVFCVPIAATQQTALEPGSVQFVQISDDSANSIRPALTKNAIIFVNGGGTRIAAILRGSPFMQSVYIAQDMTDFYQHLVKSPVALTVSQGDGQYPERFIYLLNGDGTVTIGRITGDQPIGTKQFIGWQPWSGVGKVLWVSASLGTVYYLTQYGAVNVIEVEDDTMYLDQAVSPTAPPANMVSPGKGPFTAFENGTVRLMNGLIDLGDRNVDANGNMIWGVDDDQTVTTYMAGKPFPSILQPLVREAGGEKDQDMKQKQRRRRVSRGIVTVYGSSGATWGTREIPPYNWGENVGVETTTYPPDLRETAYRTRGLGRAFDPPPPILRKDMPGPLSVLEVALEITV